MVAPSASRLGLLLIGVASWTAILVANGEVGASDVRLEISLGLHSWPDVEDLEPHAGGKLSQLLFNVAGAVHWPVRRGQDEWLLGFDVGLFPTSRNPFSGGGYVLPSVRWRPGDDRALSLNVGLGLYKVDFAQIAGDAALSRDTDAWDRTGFGGFIGGTWNINAGNRAGPMVSFEIHHVELGTVDQTDGPTSQTRSADARRLNRGFYQLHLGYRWD